MDIALRIADEEIESFPMDFPTEPLEVVKRMVDHMIRGAYVNPRLFMQVDMICPSRITCAALEPDLSDELVERIGCDRSEIDRFVNASNITTTWVPDVTAQMTSRHDESDVIRAITLVIPNEGDVGIVCCDATGAAVNAILVASVGLPEVHVHGHLPKEADAPWVCNAIEAFAREVWGRAWTPLVPEEGRC